MMTTLMHIIYSFGKIGLISLGGGNSMLKLLEYEAVEYRHWVGNEEFGRQGDTAHQLAPGVKLKNIGAIFV